MNEPMSTTARSDVKIRIVVADDHTIVREGLKLLINHESDMKVIGEASDGLEAYDQVRDLKPDVLVMDVSMPNCNGAQATARVKREFPKVKILVLTVHEERDYMHQLRRAGASGYVFKRAAAHELTEAIRHVASGQNHFDPAVTRRGALLTRKRPETRRSELSERESEVLRLLARGHTNREVATQLNISVKSVETYKARLMEKLYLHSRADLVKYALSQGWLEV
jgi:DNA-binding NarL/FixJ family response regulator